MKQALHIFLKDVRRLWLQIAGLMIAIAYFVILDIRLSVLGPEGTGALYIEAIVGAAVWFLIANVVHEESLPGENQFWLTRPYERSSLLLSKIMMAVGVVGVPLFVADCLILSMQSIPVTDHLGGLLLRQLVIGAWLIVPPFVIASITRSITEDVMVWLVAFGIAAATYFPNGARFRFQEANEKYLIVVAVALMLAVVWRQYIRRGTIGSRVMFAAAVLLPTLHFPESAAFAIEQMRNGTSDVSLATSTASISESMPHVVYVGDLHCAPIPIAIGQVHRDWGIVMWGQKDTFTSGGRTWTSGWRPALRNGGIGNFDLLAKKNYISACITSDGLSELGIGKPLAVRVSVALAIFAEEAPIKVKATFEPFDVAGMGRCQFRTYFRSENYVLACIAALWFPPQGEVAIEGLPSPIARGEDYAWTPMHLLPGLSPVYKWITLPMNNQIRETVAKGGDIEFRPERQIALLEREVAVPEVLFSIEK